jgi:hypothetical protein
MIRRVLKFLKWKKLIFGVGGILDIYRVDHKVGQFFFFKESNFQIVRVFCANKIFFLIFDTFKKKKTDQLYGPPYICMCGVPHGILRVFI